MKRITTIILLLAAIATAQCQMDTIEPCQRYEHYLYDSLWADNFSQNCNGSCDIRGMIWRIAFGTPAIVLRPCHTDTMLTIIGIAAPQMEICTPESYTNRVPEYFYLYTRDSNEFVQLKSIRWDTAVPHKVMQMYGFGEYGGYHNSLNDPNATYVSSYRVYEAYFEKPIQITGDFYVGGSIFSGAGTNEYGIMYPLTLYTRWGYIPVWINRYCRETIPDPVMTNPVLYMNENSTNTTFIPNGSLWPGFGNIFPILKLQNDSVPTSLDTCLGSNGLRVLDASGNNVTLTWNNNSTASQWQLAIVKGDTATATPENGTINSYGTNLAQLYYLDSAWYTVYLRTVCDANLGHYSQWSDTIHFQIPSPDTTFASIEPSLAERFTIVSPNPANNNISIFSSFKINHIDIIAADGTTLLSQKNDSNQVAVDLSAIPAGTLFVRISTEAGTVTKKIVKK